MPRVWTCSCGKENLTIATSCKFCRRTRPQNYLETIHEQVTPTIRTAPVRSASPVAPRTGPVARLPAKAPVRVGSQFYPPLPDDSHRPIDGGLPWYLDPFQADTPPSELCQMKTPPPNQLPDGEYVHFGVNVLGIKGNACKLFGGEELTPGNVLKAMKSRYEPRYRGQGPNNTAASRAFLDMARDQHKIIVYHMNLMAREELEAIVNRSMSYEVTKVLDRNKVAKKTYRYRPCHTVSGWELMHIHSNWGPDGSENKFNNWNTVFMRNYLRVDPPWYYLS